MKTNELTGAALDWAVDKCNFMQHSLESDYCLEVGYAPLYSIDWAHGEPIIEREGILLRPIRKQGHEIDGKWLAMYDGTNTGSITQWVKREDFLRHYLVGDTPLIAALRCYVTSKLGEEVDVPEELI